MVKNLVGQKFGILTVTERAPDRRNRVAWECSCDCGKTHVVSGAHIKTARSCGCLKSEAASVRAFVSLVGQKFGRLTVVGHGGVKNHYNWWKCRCECGKEHQVRTACLKNGTIKSCGCLLSDSSSDRAAKLTGQKFGRLTVICRAGSSSQEQALWRCLCECGKEHTTASRALTSGNTRSCGCLNRQITSDLQADKLVGRVFGKLTVKERCGTSKGGDALWKCECQCGGISIVMSHSLNTGNTRSCGNCVKSFLENDLYAWISSQIPGAVRNTRKIITPYEIDVYVPDRLAIELHGLYWHGEEMRGAKAKIDCSKKLTLMDQKNLPGRMIVFEDEWLERRPAIEGYIKALLGSKSRIGARKCIIVKGGRDFTETNHIQGAGPKDSEFTSLIYNRVTVATASFRKRGKKSGQEGDWELVRYCVSSEISVAGGLSKLLAHFWATHPEAKKLVSFSDNRLSQGRIYTATGFTDDGQTPPNYSYTKGQKRYHRFGFRKDVLKKNGWLLDGETERVCMLRMGYDRIWDAGKTRWVLARPNLP